MLGHQGVVSDVGHVIHHALLQVLDGQEVDVLAGAAAALFFGVIPAVLAQRGRLQALLQQIIHHLVGEGQHAAVRVVDDEPLLRPQQLVGDDEGTDRLLVHPAACVADHMGIALGQARKLRRVQTGVHAGHDGEFSAGRDGQLALAPKGLGVLTVGFQYGV